MRFVQPPVESNVVSGRINLSTSVPASVAFGVCKRSGSTETSKRDRWQRACQGRWRACRPELLPELQGHGSRSGSHGWLHEPEVHGAKAGGKPELCTDVMTACGSSAPERSLLQVSTAASLPASGAELQVELVVGLLLLHLDDEGPRLVLLQHRLDPREGLSHSWAP